MDETYSEHEHVGHLSYRTTRFPPQRIIGAMYSNSENESDKQHWIFEVRPIHQKSSCHTESCRDVGTMGFGTDSGVVEDDGAAFRPQVS